MAATTTASMMARVDRLDLLLGYLEEMHRNGNGNASPPSATTASSPSTLAAGGVHLISSDDDVDVDSSAGPSTPTWRRPRPAKEVLEEAQAKGSLIDRIASLEHRVLKVILLFIQSSVVVVPPTYYIAMPCFCCCRWKRTWRSHQRTRTRLATSRERR